MSMDQYTLGGIKIGSTVIKSIQNSNIAPNITPWLIGGDGSARNTFSAVANAKPEIGFTTTSIKIALGAAGLTGATLAAAEFYLNKLSDGGLRASGSAHFKGTAVGGLIFPSKLSAQQGQPATITYRCILKSADGTVIPLTIVTNSAALTGEGQTTELYTLGEVAINGTILDTVEGFEIDFGIQEIATTPYGLIYPTEVSIMKIDPTITITTPDITVVSDFMTQQGATDSTLKLVDVTQLTGLRGSSPITFTIDEGTIYFDSKADAAHGNKTTGKITIKPVYDTVAEVIAISGI